MVDGGGKQNRLIIGAAAEIWGTAGRCPLHLPTPRALKGG